VIASLAPAEIESFRNLVAERLGLFFDDAKLDFLADVLRKRMEETGCQHFAAYRGRVIASSGKRGEIGALAEQLTVGETYFFRYCDHLRAFAEVVIPSRIEARGGERRLRILSAGCASGEEPYSLAILLRERFANLAPWQIELSGFDVNPRAVEKALHGRYPEWSLRETPEDLRSRYFRSVGRDFQLDESVRSAVTFEQRNLVEEDRSFWLRESFDAVFCRNVLMYLTPDVTRSVVARIARCIAPGGFLFLGHAETLRGVSQEFHLQHTHETFYYQRQQAHEAQSTATDTAWATTVRAATASALPELVEPNDTWYGVIQTASERIATLTGDKARSAVGTVESAPQGVAISRAKARAAVWDRAPALELLRRERFREATELVNHLPPEAKTDPDTQLLLAVLLANSGELLEAEKVCEQILHLDDLSAGAHYLMALCKEHAGDSSDAIRHDQAAAYLDSAFAMPHLHLGLIAKRSADVETARRELGRALSLLDREDASRVLLFGGGFTREALVEFCGRELRACGGGS
jgi:chemotaxis protein methyltransferase CheR